MTRYHARPGNRQVPLWRAVLMFAQAISIVIAMFLVILVLSIQDVRP